MGLLRIRRTTGGPGPRSVADLLGAGPVSPTPAGPGMAPPPAPPGPPEASVPAPSPAGDASTLLLLL